MNHGSTIAKNTTKFSGAKRRRIDPGWAPWFATRRTNKGTMNPTGPLTKVAKPAAAAATKYQFRRFVPSLSSARNPAKIAPQVNRVRVMSKITVLEYDTNNGVVAITMTARAAQRWPKTRRQKA